MSDNNEIVCANKAFAHVQCDQPRVHHTINNVDFMRFELLFYEYFFFMSFFFSLARSLAEMMKRHTRSSFDTRLHVYCFQFTSYFERAIDFSPPFSGKQTHAHIVQFTTSNIYAANIK